MPGTAQAGSSFLNDTDFDFTTIRTGSGIFFIAESLQPERGAKIHTDSDR
jgi:hypothetical protein